MTDKASLQRGVNVFDGQYILRVAKDGLSATLRAKKADADTDWSHFDVMAELNAQGVVFGLVDPPISSKDGKMHVVAKGIPPVVGENARIQLHVRPAQGQVQREDTQGQDKDKVNFRELGNVVNVTKGQVLAQKIPATAGTPGRSVLGEEVLPKPGKDITIKGGLGVVVSQDGMTMSSDVDGKFVMADGKPTVLTKHLVNSDVDMTVGNITFGGELLQVAGWVMPGFVIRVKGNVEIGEGIDNAYVDAGGDLKVKGSLLGENGMIKAGGDVFVKIVENTSVEAGGNLFVGDYVLQGHVKVGKDMVVTKNKGAVIGGTHIVGGSLHVKELGDEAEMSLEVSVGVQPDLMEKKRKMEADLKAWPEKLNEVIRNISSLEQIKKRSGGVLPPDKENLRRKLSNVMPVIMKQIDSLTEEEKKVNEQLQQFVNACVYVYGTVYPGATVRIGTIARQVTIQEDRVVIHLDRTTMTIGIRKMSEDEFKKGNIQ